MLGRFVRRYRRFGFSCPVKGDRHSVTNVFHVSERNLERESACIRCSRRVLFEGSEPFGSRAAVLIGSVKPLRSCERSKSRSQFDDMRQYPRRMALSDMQTRVRLSQIPSKGNVPRFFGLNLPFKLCQPYLSRSAQSDIAPSRICEYAVYATASASQSYIIPGRMPSTEYSNFDYCVCFLIGTS